MSGDSWENQVTVEDVVGQLTRSQVTVEDFRWPLRMSGITVEVSERSDRLRVASLTHEMPQSTFLTAHLTILGPIYTRDFLSSFLEQSSSKWTFFPVVWAIVFQMDFFSPFLEQSSSKWTLYPRFWSNHLPNGSLVSISDQSSSKCGLFYLPAPASRQ